MILSGKMGVDSHWSMPYFLFLGCVSDARPCVSTVRGCGMQYSDRCNKPIMGRMQFWGLCTKSLRRVIHRIQCSIHKIQCSIYKLQCSKHKSQCSKHKSQCFIHKTHCSIYKTQCSKHKPQCSKHLLRCDFHKIEWALHKSQRPSFTY